MLGRREIVKTPDRMALYVDELNLASVGRLLLRRPGTQPVFYFDCSPLLKLFRPILNWFGPDFQKIDFCLGDLRNENGSCLFEEILGEKLNGVCAKIAADDFPDNSLINTFKNAFGREPVELYLIKKISRSIESALVLIHAVDRHFRSIRSSAESRPVFLLSHALSGALKKYAEEMGIQAEPYFQPARWGRRCSRMMGSLAWPVQSLAGLFHPPRRLDGRRGLIAAAHNGKDISFDPGVKSDLFWLIPPSLPRDRVLFCFTRGDYPADKPAIDLLEQNRVNFVAMDPKARIDPRVPVYRPSWKCLGESLKWNFRILCDLIFFSSARAGRRRSFYADILIDFVRRFSRYTDFFSRYGIKIFLTIDDYNDDSVPAHLAIRAAGGISVGYQFANLSVPYGQLTLCRDVYFGFGPHYRAVLEKSRALISNLVYVGYVTDQSFKAVAGNAKHHREILHRAGAKFILCFLDENSSDHRMSCVPHKTSADIYRSVLKTLVADPSLGLILKPGYPRTLFRRIPEIVPLVEQAKSTGRCLWIDAGVIVTHAFPAEAAQASDLVVGLLFSGTAALESSLSGIRTVYLDVEKLLHRPEYGGERRVVFNSWDDLWTAVQVHRNSPDEFSGFGDLSPSLSDKDPYRDGQAAVRMSEYLRWLIEFFEKQESAESAVKNANHHFRERWGADRVQMLKTF